MTWSTAQVARLSGVSSRTLRHYHEIGLLTPAAVAHSGLRYYGREELLRLQQIMLLRDLGLGLEAIGRLVNGGEDVIAQLRRHHRWLTGERDRYDRLAATVARTIEEMEGGEKVSTEKLFEGFDADRQARYEAELVERYGDDVATHIEASRSRMAGRDAAWHERQREIWLSINSRLVGLIVDGAGVSDPRVREVIGEHHRWLSEYWTPNRESYTGLGRLYAESPDFRSQFDAQHPRLAEFVRDAMADYAAANL